MHAGVSSLSENELRRTGTRNFIVLEYADMPRPIELNPGLRVIVTKNADQGSEVANTMCNIINGWDALTRHKCVEDPALGTADAGGPETIHRSQ